ncbi:MAG: hypothetical protein J6330_08055 [Clostridia bacterium]|nr:hypothetical protein [Clostridia bacterium]
MRELINDPFYKLIEEYDDCMIDYCLIEDDTPDQGYRSHKDAVLFAMLKAIERYIDEQLKSEVMYCSKIHDEPFLWNLDIGKAKAHRIDPAQLLHVPKILRTDRLGQRFYDCDFPDFSRDGHIPYWYAFWEPPHTSGYGPDDFNRVNSALFPQGTDELEVYEWTTDWSNYFEDGYEWWGAACWSVYDRRMNRFTVIMASATD